MTAAPRESQKFLNQGNTKCTHSGLCPPPPPPLVILLLQSATFRSRNSFRLLVVGMRENPVPFSTYSLPPPKSCSPRHVFLSSSSFSSSWSSRLPPPPRDYLPLKLSDSRPPPTTRGPLTMSFVGGGVSQYSNLVRPFSFRADFSHQIVVFLPLRRSDRQSSWSFSSPLPDRTLQNALPLPICLAVASKTCTVYSLLCGAF